MKNDDDNDVSDNESKDSSRTDIPVDYSTKESIVHYLQQLKDNYDAPFNFVKKIDLDLLRELWGLLAFLLCHELGIIIKYTFICILL